MLLEHMGRKLSQLELDQILSLELAKVSKP